MKKKLLLFYAFILFFFVFTQTRAQYVSTTPTCNDNYGTATVVGDFAEHYRWSGTDINGQEINVFNDNNVITGLAPGYYLVELFDINNNKFSQNYFQINQSYLVNYSSKPVSCGGNGSDGEIHISPIGGVEPYTYQWTDGNTSKDRINLGKNNYSVTVTDATGCSNSITIAITDPPEINIDNYSYTNILMCNGNKEGYINFYADGSSGPYSYEWDTTPVQYTSSLNSLGAGTYTVKVTDTNNCIVTKSFTISEPDPLVLVPVSQTNIACRGGNTGSATVDAKGGAGYYTYSWAPSGGTAATATGLAAGTYTVTVTDANGCTGTVSPIVTQPPALGGTTVVTNVACFGNNTGAINLTPTGGVGPYTFDWGGGITTEDRTSLTAGSYSVTITDANSCTATVNATVSQPAAVVSGTTAVTNVACFGGNNGAINLTPTGGVGPYTYNWVGGATTEDRTGLTAGTYSVTITDANGCTGTVSGITVLQPAAAVSGTTVVTNVACFGGNTGAINLTPTGGTGPYTYNWVGGATTEDRILLTAGSYSVTITDANSCTGTVSGITVTQPAAAVSGTTVVTNLDCFGDNTASINLTPTGGTGPYTFNWGGGITTEDRTGLTAGSYSVTITDANGCTGTVSPIVTQPASALNASTGGGKTDVSCNSGANGTATVFATGGKPGYTYSWAPSGGTNATASGLSAGTYTVTVTDANGCQATRSFTINQPTALVASQGTIINVSCNGGTNGSATVNVTGGTPSYTYSWSPSGGTAASATGLTAGTYTVTVTDDNNCQSLQSFTIDEHAVLTSGISKTDVLCNGGATGTATVTPTGGTAGYTYQWSPTGGTAATASGLSIGNYSCLITDANGCSITKNITINQPSTLGATTAQTNATCSAGGDASVTPFGGVGAYTYSWTPGGQTTQFVTGLSAGNYSCLITDGNGCTITKNFIITTNNTLVASTFQTNLLCNGSNTGSAGVIPSGAPGPFTYVWSPSGGNADTATNLAAGSYSVQITSSNGCSITKNFTITQPTALVATAGAQTNLLCNGGTTGSATVNVTGGTGAYTYVWAPTGGTAATASGLTAGTYTVTVKDANLCQTTQSFTITQPTALVATAGAQTNVSCNGGTNGSATVNVTGGTGSYTYLWAPSGGTAASATGLAAGTYTVTIKDANLCQTTQSFTITQPNTLVATAGAQTNVLCNGGTTGSATVNVTGGTGAYTYVWTPTGGTAATASGLAAGTYTVTVKDANLCQTTQSFTITLPTTLSLTAASQTNIACNGGSTGAATVNVATGGTAGYTYNWTPGNPTGDGTTSITGVPAGTWTCTVTDANGCTASQSFTITQPSVLTASAGAQTNVSCNSGANGSATVNVTGGTGAYTYSWAPSGGTAATASGLTAGTYTVTVTDANACTATQSFTITESSTLIASAGAQTNVSCNSGSNGSATVNVTGGTGTYIYSWAPSGGTAATAAGLTAGTYTVTVTDANSCTATQSFTITEPSTLTASAGVQTNVSCNSGANGSATVSVTGGTGAYSYSWSPSSGTAATASGLTAGTYTVTVKDANLCQTTQSFTITQPTALIATAGTQTNILCNGAATGAATVNVTGGTGAYSYSWSPSGGTVATASGLTAGTYTVTVTDANGCTASQSFTITQPSALIASAGAQTNVSCNSGANGSATVNVTGGTGAYTYSWAPSGGTAATASGLTAGTYTVTVTDANSCTATQSFTITEPSTLIASAGAQTNVSCNSGANGLATVNVSGGTGAYTYSWTPSGGTAATAAGLTAGTYTVTVTDVNACTASQSFTITEPVALKVTENQTNISCYNGNTGEASVLVTGGVNPYTYQWSNTVSTGSTAGNLTAGTYVCTITDKNNCTISQSFTITQPANAIGLITLPAEDLTSSSASLTIKANPTAIDADQGECMKEVGLVYSITANPTINDTKVLLGNNTGTFAKIIDGLQGNTMYYVRAFAINNSGFINYGNEISFTTEKYLLKITASQNQTKVYGTTEPILTYTATGFANGDTDAVLTGSLNRELGENTGLYAIKAGNLNAGPNYLIDFVPANFVITKADQIINWDQDLNFGCDDVNELELNATSTSGLPISYSVQNNLVAEIISGKLTIKKAGTTTITAFQDGDENHYPASQISKEVEVSHFGNIIQHWDDVLFFDNKNSNYTELQWYKNGAIIQGATQQFYSEKIPLNGIYHLVAKDKEGNIIKFCPLTLEGKSFSKSIKLYPNPVASAKEFTIECDYSQEQLKDAVITIYDLSGKTVATVSNVSPKTLVIAPSTSAVYIVILTLEDGKQKMINLLVR